MTDAERKLWWRVRAGSLPGYRFRRQVPLGPFIVDFACLAARLVIEVDGGQHARQVEQDGRRTAWLESQGFRVLRFWNLQVLQETDDVIDAIWATLEFPPPSWGRAREGGCLSSSTHSSSNSA